MQTLYPEKLEPYLQQTGTPPVLLVFGDDLLLRNDALTVIRKHLAGNDLERVHWLQSKDFDWQQLSSGEQSMSLFGNLRLIELELPENKPGRDGSAALTEYAQNQTENEVLVVIGDRLKKETQNSRWFKALSERGPLVRTQSPDKSQLPAFIHQRAQRYQLTLAKGVPEKLSDWFEGNLLALDQELSKWQLLTNDGVITEDFLKNSIDDVSRFSVFALQESIQQQDFDGALHRLSRLLDEENDFHRLIWILQREVQLLTALKKSQQAQSDATALFRQFMIWPNQQPGYHKRSTQLDMKTLQGAHRLVERIEAALKLDSGESPLILTTHLLSLLCCTNADEINQALSAFNHGIEPKEQFIQL
ncbi:DNA polymerase III subunit delta [Idiomarina sp. HP20-50]|uniref:DNA polymerase III subunit delta n=1 Tax=Idiomarina sp. HP20-50 TaxID=3070813 RepID=UPI00294B639B|nr:DNA polymerase III subunit delta [Idiomarina sp. HP20-50]MDV6315482.1 DNA polymerase III subunit delta [Idiomarina sp. HP20-50]